LRSQYSLAAAALASAIAIAPHTVRAQAEHADLSDYALASPVHDWRISNRLKEISGLAMSSDNRLFAHDDERAVIYEIDYNAGNLVKAFALGDRPAVGDFEGIAIVDTTFYLVTSEGRIYETTEGADGDHRLYNTYGTGIGRSCEVEGLAFEPADRTLLLACKTPRTPALEDWVTIFRWSIDTRSMAQDSMLQISLRSVLDRIGTNRFRPSGIERHPISGHYLIIAAQQRAIIEISKTGTLLAHHRFHGNRREHIEGIAFSSRGDLFLAAESGGKGHGELAIFAAAQN